MSYEDELYRRFAEAMDMIQPEKTASPSDNVSTADRECFRKKHQDAGCSLGKDDKGFFVYTHRARCKSYPTPDDIPADKVKFISSTS